MLSELGVMSVALLLCKGSVLQKCFIITEMLLSTNEDSSDQNVQKDNKQISLILMCMFEFALVYYPLIDQERKKNINLFYDRNQTIENQLTIIKPFIKQMVTNESDDNYQLGVVQCIFGRYNHLPRNTFIIKLLNDECTWLFEIKKIQ